MDDVNLGQEQAQRQRAVRGAIGMPYGTRSGMNRMMQITFAGNGYIVNEHLQGPYETVPAGKPFMVFPTPVSLIAYLTEQLMGNPDNHVASVEPEQAGLDLGPVPDRAEDHFELDDSALTDLGPEPPNKKVRAYRDNTHNLDCPARVVYGANCTCLTPE